MTRFRISEPSVLVSNERIKAAAGLLFNLGGALFAATAVKVYSDPVFDRAVLLWSLATAALIYAAWLVLSLLEREPPETLK